MKDIWGQFLGQTLTAVLHADRPDSGVVCQVFLVFVDEEGYESHVELYSNYADFRWSNARGGGLDTLGRAVGDAGVTVWERGG